MKNKFFKDNKTVSSYHMPSILIKVGETVEQVDKNLDVLEKVGNMKSKIVTEAKLQTTALPEIEALKLLRHLSKEVKHWAEELRNNAKPFEQAKEETVYQQGRSSGHF